LPNPSHPSLPDADGNKTRVAYLLSRYPGISHTFFLKEVLGLRERGLVVEVASINPSDRARHDLPETEAAEADSTFYVKAGLVSLAFKVFAVTLRHPGVAIRGMAAALSLGGWDLRSRVFALFYLAEALLIGAWMRRRSLPHLHVHFGGPVATVGLLTAKAWKIPWSLTLHGPDEFFDQDFFYLRQKIESAGFIVCISDFCRCQVLRIAPELPDAHTEVVRLGVDCVALKPNPRGSVDDVQVSVFRLVCTGRMVAAKGHRILLEALAPLVSAGANLSCTLVGDGPERPFLESLAARLGLAGQVHFLGALAHQQTLDQVAQADVFVLASFAEGLPVALMEAMALGVPCVSTTIAAIPELIQDEVNGLLVAPANPQALSEALAKLAADPDLRHRLGVEARRTVETHYNLARNLDLLAETWKRRLHEKQ
jgi:glycosyltransferase involved in cell wall biosynthesis